MPITLTVSTSSLNLMAADCKQVGGVGQGGQKHCWESGAGTWPQGQELRQEGRRSIGGPGLRSQKGGTDTPGLRARAGGAQEGPKAA